MFGYFGFASLVSFTCLLFEFADSFCLVVSLLCLTFVWVCFYLDCDVGLVGIDLVWWVDVLWRAFDVCLQVCVLGFLVDCFWVLGISGLGVFCCAMILVILVD